MGRINTIDAIHNLSNGDTNFLEKTLYIFCENVIPFLKGCSSQYADDVACLFMKVYDYLIYNESHKIERDVAADIIWTSEYNNVNKHILQEKGKLLTYDGLSSLSKIVGRKNIRDYSRPGNYRETWYIWYNNKNGKFVPQREFWYKHCTKGEIIYNLYKPNPDFIDSDYFIIHAGIQEVHVQISQTGKVVIVYIPDTNREVIQDDPWKKTSIWNTWVFSNFYTTPNYSIHGDLRDKRKAPGYLSCRIPRFAQPSNDKNDVINIMMEQLITDLKTGNYLKPKPKQKTLLQKRKQSIFKRIIQWLDGLW